jgi:hypothetical protein
VIKEEHYGVFGAIISAHCVKVRNIDGRRYSFDIDTAIRTAYSRLAHYVSSGEILAAPPLGKLIIEGNDLEIHMGKTIVNFVEKIYALKNDNFNFISKSVISKSAY